jgi:hypothetical protein
VGPWKLKIARRLFNAHDGFAGSYFDIVLKLLHGIAQGLVPGVAIGLLFVVI